VVQAYRDLAADGFVELRHGQGTYIKEIPSFQRDEERTAQATRLVRKLLQDAARVGIGVEELADAFRTEAGAEIRE
jgi:DNA-binding transcriptional regulator YhcF (GntR family)